MQQKPETKKIDVTTSSHTDFMKVMPTLQKTGEKDTEKCLDLICNILEVDCHPEDIKKVIRLGQKDKETD